MLSDTELEALVKRAITVFNQVKAPQVTSKLVSFSPEFITVEFSGLLCFDCTTQNIADSFIKDFKAVSKEAELKQGKTKETNSHSIQTTFQLKQK